MPETGPVKNYSITKKRSIFKENNNNGRNFLDILPLEIVFI
jgi:hypothetical protein